MKISAKFLILTFSFFLMNSASLADQDTRSNINIGIIGQLQDSGASVLAAMTYVQSTVYGRGDVYSLEQIKSAPVEKERGIEIATVHIQYESDTRNYTIVYSPTHTALMKNMITGAAKMNGAVLVVSVNEGVTKQIHEDVRLARATGVSAIVAYLDGVETTYNEKLIAQRESEIRGLLEEYDFPVFDIPILTGSALKALEGDTSDAGVESILKLVKEMDTRIPEPVRDIDRPFLLPIEDVFSITGRGTVVTGRVERGVIKVGEEVEIVGIRDTVRTTCTGVEMFRKLRDEGSAGDNVGVLLRGVKHDEIQRGQVLAQPKTITPNTKFEAEVYILSKDEGGRHQPFFKGYLPQFYFRTMDVKGAVTLPDGIEMVMPGDNVQMKVELVDPIAMEEGLRFAIREGGRTVGVGTVTKTYE